MPYISEILDSLQKADEATLAKHGYNGLTDAEKSALATKDVQTYSGKVRDVVFNGDSLEILHSDRLSAFDRYIGLVPYKGTILTDISAWWLEEAEKIVPTHYQGRPGERTLEVEKCEPVKVEVIVRGYLAGSMLRAYEKGERTFCGVKLPDGLKPWGPLPEAIITPTTKAEAFEHDEDTTPEELIKAGVCTKEDWNFLAEKSLALFAHGQKVYGELGWILVDTKYEFGRSKGGALKLIDEAHTPDSSRLWVRDTYDARLKAGETPEMLDKEIVRRYLLDQGFSGKGDVPPVPAERLVALSRVYLQVAEKLRGKRLETAGPAGN